MKKIRNLKKKIYGIIRYEMGLYIFEIFLVEEKIYIFCKILRMNYLIILNTEISFEILLSDLIFIKYNIDNYI